MEVKDLQDKLALQEAELKKLREEKDTEVVKLRDENKLKDRRLADLERRNLLAEIERDVVKLRDEGRVTPAEVNSGLIAYLAALPDGEVQLGEKKTTLRKWLTEFLGSRQAVVVLGSSPLPTSTDEGKGIRADVLPKHLTKKELAAVDQKRAELASRGKEIQLREQKTNPKFSYLDAVILAEKENPHLVER